MSDLPGLPIRPRVRAASIGGTGRTGLPTGSERRSRLAEAPDGDREHQALRPPSAVAQRVARSPVVQSRRHLQSPPVRGSPGSVRAVQTYLIPSTLRVDVTFRIGHLPLRGATAVASAIVVLFVLSAIAQGTASRPPSSSGFSSVDVHAFTNTTNTVVATVDVPGGPTSLSATFDPTNGYVYFESNGTNLTGINGASNRVAYQKYLGPYANSNSATPNYVGGTVNDLYVPVVSTDPPPDNVTVISGSTGLVLKYLSTGHNSYPTTGVFDPVNGYLYVPAMGA